MKLWIFLLLALVLVGGASASILNPSATGANSRTYAQNYDDGVGGALQAGINTTIQYTVGSVTYLTVPEFQSSTACLLNGTGLTTTYLGVNAVNATLYEVRSDAFSEAGIVLALSNRSNEFHAWVNFLEIMDLCGYGQLPCWVVARNNSIGGNQVGLAGGQNDTAIDGSARAALALYLAANNSDFTAANRTHYQLLAINLTRDIYLYETISIPSKATRANVNVSRLPMGGGDCAAAGLGCSTDMWVGYLGDIIQVFQRAYYVTRNSTYDSFARNVTAATISVSLQNDTDGDGFGVAPFNFNWDNSSTLLGHSAGGGVNTYHYDKANPQWDDSDAVRFQNFPDVVRIQNLTNGTIDGPYINASNYTRAWIRTGAYNRTSSSVQYYYNGTCATNCLVSGLYENGLGVGVTTYHNTSMVSGKVNETLSHMSWSTYRYDSTSCGTALSFRGSKAWKSLGIAIGLDEAFLSAGANTSPIVTSASANASAGLNRTDETLSFYCGGTDAEGQDIAYSYIVFKNGVVFEARNVTLWGTDACLQESANVSSSCGGVTGGRYSLDSLGGTGFLAATYARPLGAANDTTIQYRIGDDATANISIPAQCWNTTSPNITLRLTSSLSYNGGYGAGVSSLQCYDGNAFVDVVGDSSSGSPASPPFAFGISPYTYDGNYESCTAYYQPEGWAGFASAVYDGGLICEEAINWRFGFPNGSVNWVTSISAVNTSRGDNFTISCAGVDGTSQGAWVNGTGLVIANTAPNTTSSPIVEIGGTMLNCSHEYADLDGDAENATSYRWFRNGTLIAPVTVNLSSGNYTLTDSIICEITPSDGYGNGTRVNSSTFVVGDVTAPSITQLGVPGSGTISEAITISANCSDAYTLASGFPKVSWTNPNGVIEGNFSMTLNSGTGLFEKAYTFSTVGAYTDFTFSCRDGSGNTATEVSSTSLAISTGTSSGGGNSGGTEACGFTLVRPVNGYANLKCPPGGKSDDFAFRIFNNQYNQALYSVTVEGVACSVAETSFAVGGRSQYDGIVTGCVCPTGEGEAQGKILIETGQCSVEIPVRLYENWIARFLDDPDAMFLVILIVGGLLVVVGVSFAVLGRG